MKSSSITAIVVIGAVQSAAAARGNVEVVDSEVGGGDADGEAKGVTKAADLDDINPEEEDLDADAAEVGELVGGDAAGYGGAVAELVRSL